jgi:hypothetical protein
VFTLREAWGEQLYGALGRPSFEFIGWPNLRV